MYLDKMEISGTWCQKHFGGVNSKAYEKIFELLLRLKANYFWPAMWATAFNEDDPESPRLADEMGIVMGTSHHEPMMRSHREYLKPKEMPISFIMDYAWRGPSAFGPLPPAPKWVRHTIYDDEFEWLRQWTASVLGGNYAQVAFEGIGAKIPEGIVDQEITYECAKIIEQYSKLNLMRKPEVQVPGLFNYEEMLHLNNQWQSIVLRCEALKERIPAEAQDAFYQLVYYPAVASAGVAMMYNAATMGDRETVDELMEKDKRLTDYYNKVMAGGNGRSSEGHQAGLDGRVVTDEGVAKWDGMMLDNHIGYTKWSIPDKNTNPMDLGYKVNHDLSASKGTREYSIAADSYQQMGEGWMELPGLGRGDCCVGAADVMKSYPNGDGPVLEYDIDLIPEQSSPTRNFSLRRQGNYCHRYPTYSGCLSCPWPASWRTD